MDWPTAVERSADHFATAYLWHDVLTGLAGWIVWGLAFGFGATLALFAFAWLDKATVKGTRQDKGSAP